MSSYVRFCLTLGLLVSKLFGQAAEPTGPVGRLAFEVPAGLSGMSFPLQAPDIAAGVVSSNTIDTITFDAAAGGIGPLLQSDHAYYVEILSGAHTGERFDVDTAATIATASATVSLTLNANSHSTLPAIEFSLAGERAVVRPHVTLTALAAMFSPALVGSDDPAQADGVRIYGAGQFVHYHVRADGVTWSREDSLNDERDFVIPPDVSIILDVKSGSKRLIQMGAVRTTSFRKNLRTESQAYSTGFPIDLTLAEGRGAVDDEESTQNRWRGENDAAQADEIEVFDPVVNSFIRYYLRGDGTSWRRLGHTENDANTALLKVNTMIMVRRANSDQSYRIAPPFSL